MCFPKIMKKIQESWSRAVYWFACHVSGYCPTSTEIENDTIQKLAQRLQGATEEETLTNILEWQDSNIAFWDERHPLPIVLFYSIVFVFPVLLAFGYFFVLVLYLIYHSFLISSFLLVWVSALVSSIVTTIAIMVVLIKSNRKIGLKNGLSNAFKFSISIQMLVRRDRKLGICRDYAKLTACLLSNIYKDSEIYFCHSEGHVATGIAIGKELYMLDQHLPLLTVNQWFKRENNSDIPSKIPFLFRKAHKLKNNQIHSIPISSLLSKTDTTRLNSPEELASEISNLLNLPKEKLDNTKEVLSIELPKWTNGASLYAMNDRVVNYSLERALKRKVSNELIEMRQVTEIKAKKENKDMVFKVFFTK